MSFPGHHILQIHEREEREERELCARYKAVFCTPLGAEVLYDITENLCRCHSTTDDTPEDIALKNLALTIRARLGLADEDYIKQEIRNAPGVSYP